MTKHIFDVDTAQKCGMAAAVVYERIRAYAELAEARGEARHDGRQYIRASMASLSAEIPYLSPHQVRTALDKLTDAGLLLKSFCSEEKMDRTAWYALSIGGMKHDR